MPKEPKAPVEPVEYRVAPGRAVTTKKGILRGGDEIKVNYVSSEQAFERLVKIGVIEVKKK